jgi:hypothetical protein
MTYLKAARKFVLHDERMRCGQQSQFARPGESEACQYRVFSVYPNGTVAANSGPMSKRK